MKKKQFFITLFFLSISFLFAQTPFEGFDGFPWNTNVSEFLKKYPSAKETTDTNEIERNERTENNKEYFSLWSNISSTFSIEVTEIKYFNTYGRATGIDMFITYENTKIREEADEYFKEKKKKNIEL